VTSLTLSFAAKKAEFTDMQPLAAVAVHTPHLQALSLKLGDFGKKPGSNLAGLAAAAASWPLLTSFITYLR
jgi:hypothetical protein